MPPPFSHGAALYRQLAESSTDAVLTIDEDGRILAANTAAERLFGHDAAELANRTIRDLFPELARFTDSSETAHDPAGSRRAPSPRRLRVAARTSSGADRPVELSLAALPAASPDALQASGESRFSVILRDLSHPGSTDDDLRYRLALDAARIGTWEWDAQSDITSFDERVRELLGIEQRTRRGSTELIGRRVHEVDREKVARALRAAASLEGDGHFEAEFRVVRPDGDVRWVRAVGRMHFAGSGAARKPKRLIGTIVDVTDHESARREAEVAHARVEALNAELRRAVADLQTVLDVVPIGIGIARDPECSEIRVNPAFAAQLGITDGTNASKSSESGASLPFRIMHDGVEVPPDQLPMQLAAREGRTFADMEFDIVHEDGRVIRLLEYASPVIDSAGNVRGSVGAFIDITERARLIQAERQARAEAEQANRAKSEFLAVMSHELRTPLNAIGGYAELLAMGIRGPVTPQQREDLERLRRSQKHLLRLIDEVLNYARLETGTVNYDVTPVEVANAFSSVEALMLPQLQMKSLSLDIVPPGADLVVQADAERLQQILLNLLSNSAKFTDSGGRIELTARQAPDASDDRMVEITVRDTGIGIPDDQLETIFEPFVQVGRALNRPAEGAGLGLAISRDLARGMRGDLVARSALGRGSEFVLKLPMGDRS